VTRCALPALGIPDDRVAATVHRYLEVKKDTQVHLQCAAMHGHGVSPTVPPLSSPQVIEIIQAAAAAMGGLVDLPTVLEVRAPCCLSAPVSRPTLPLVMHCSSRRQR